MERNKELMLREPGTFARRLFHEFDRFFDERATGAFFRPRRRGGEFPWMPDLELFERDNNLIVHLDLPGIGKDEISVDVSNGLLSIEGERKRETEEQKTDWYTSERSYGHFRREIPLPEGIKAESVKANFTDGVLEVTVPLPAAAMAAPKKIAIEGKAPEIAKTAGKVAA